jgi:two-component system, NarL family, nitrate/nitrite response regulator NarL
MERAPIRTVPIGTVLVGPNVLLREGLARILGAADFRILASASGVDDPVLLSSLPEEQPILLIIDVSDDFDTALAQIGSFKQRYPTGRVAVLAHQHQLTEMVSAFRLGANAYLVNVATCDTFIKSLELVMLGVTLLPPEILTFVSDRQDCSRGATGHNGHAAVDVDVADDEDDPDNGHADDDDGGDDGEMVGAEVATNEHLPKAKSSYPPRLSARQQSILRCLIQGDSNKTIARKMAIAEATVKVHVKAILRRIRVHNRTQAAIWAMNNGPFLSAKDDASQVLEELPVEPFPGLDVAHVLSSGHKNGSKSLPALQLKGTSHVGLPSIVRLVRKGIGRKDD